MAAIHDAHPPTVGGCCPLATFGKFFGFKLINDKEILNFRVTLGQEMSGSEHISATDGRVLSGFGEC